jgi:Tfp pilus assembly protein PilF
VSPAAVQSVNGARSLKQSGEPARAVQSLERTTSANPDYYLAQYHLALAATDAGQLDKAIDAFKRAMEIRTKENIPEYTIFNSFGWTYLLAGKLNRAEKQFKEGEKHADKLNAESRGRLFNNMGWMYMQWGRHELARKYFEDAVKLGYADARTNLAHLKSLQDSVR